jgi:DNA-binding GntR family transcriptional regulator
MLVLRVHLETLAVRLAYANPVSRVFSNLGPVIDMMRAVLERTAEPDADTWGQMALLDTEFHTRLVEASKSEALRRAWVIIAPTDLLFLHDMRAGLRNPVAISTLSRTVDVHLQLLKCLQSGDQGVALAGLAAHFTEPPRGDEAIFLDEASLAVLGVPDGSAGWCQGASIADAGTSMPAA